MVPTVIVGPSTFDVTEDNIAGVEIPVLNRVSVPRAEYDLFETAPWIDDAVDAITELTELRIAREILERGVDGLMIDVLRHPPMAQYDQPLVDAFMAQTGSDPRRLPGHGTEEWLRFRAMAFADLLRDLRRMMDAQGHAAKPIYVRAMPQPWRLLRDGCDVEAWVREGLVHTFIAGHHCITAPGVPAYYDLAPMRRLLGGRARLIAQVWRSADLHSALALGRQAYDQGADGTAIYESNQFVTLPSYRGAVWSLRAG